MIDIDTLYLPLYLLVLECQFEGVKVVLLHPLVAGNLYGDVHQVVELVLEVLGDLCYLGLVVFQLQFDELKLHHFMNEQRKKMNFVYK